MAMRHNNAIYTLVLFCAIYGQNVKVGNVTVRQPPPPRTYNVHQGSTQPLEFTGVNIAGGEFGHSAPGVTRTYGVHYIFPSSSQIDYFASKGVNISTRTVREPNRGRSARPSAASGCGSSPPGAGLIISAPSWANLGHPTMRPPCGQPTTCSILWRKTGMSGWGLPGGQPARGGGTTCSRWSRRMDRTARR